MQRVLCKHLYVIGADVDEKTGVVGRILDPDALKAVAHPLRYRLLETLIELGPSTASALGRIVGENSGSTSYHLRKLAAHGFIAEEPELGTGRDRYWRVVEGGWSLEGFDMLQREDTREAATFLLDKVTRDRIERVHRWHAEGPLWGKAWVEATTETTSRLRLTRTQLAALRDEVYELLERYRAQQVGDDTDDSAQIGFHVDLFPIEAPPPEPLDEAPALETEPGERD